MLRSIGLPGVVVCVLLVPGLVVADPVTIRAKDNSVVLNGEILFYDQENMDLDTPVGKIRVSRADIVCEGAACPEDHDAAAPDQRTTAKLSD